MPRVEHASPAVLIACGVHLPLSVPNVVQILQDQLANHALLLRVEFLYLKKFLALLQQTEYVQVVPQPIVFLGHNITLLVSVLALLMAAQLVQHVVQIHTRLLLAPVPVIVFVQLVLHVQVGTMKRWHVQV